MHFFDTKSAIEMEEVNPGESIPNKFISPLFL